MTSIIDPCPECGSTTDHPCKHQVALAITVLNEALPNGVTSRLGAFARNLVAAGSYDHVWLRSLDSSSQWTDLYRNELDEAAQAELKADAERLVAGGHFVTLSAGGNCVHDELILFEDGEDAGEFYASGFMTWECFRPGDLIGCGFQQVALYESGRILATKAVPPTGRRTGTVDHGVT